MSIEMPEGKYARVIVKDGAWPDVDENMLYDRANEFTRVLHDVTEVLDICREQRTQIFDGGLWSGEAAHIASKHMDHSTTQLASLQRSIAAVIDTHNRAASAIWEAKSTITDIVTTAEQRILSIKEDRDLDAKERRDAVNDTVSDAHTSASGVVTLTAERIRDIFNTASTPGTIGDEVDHDAPAPPTAVPPHPDTNGDGVPVTQTPSGPVAGGPGRGGSTLNPVSSPQTTTQALPEEEVAESTTEEPVVTGTGGFISPISSAAAGSGGFGKGMAPAAVSGVLTPPARGREDAAPVAPSNTSSSAAASSGAAAGPGAAAAAALRPSTGSTPRAGAPGARAGAPTHPELPDRGSGTPHGASPMVVPVSASRAERDAIAEATAVESSDQRAGGKKDPLNLARRIAAALNVQSQQQPNIGFQWITAVTVDGHIVVANSYGIGYIPQDVQLPDQVYMASADSDIPLEERARWATYPVLAVQGWAAHHNTSLRAVIGTAEQFADTDPGAAKIILHSEDIPEHGIMTGRSRLEVLNPGAALRLASVSNSELSSLLTAVPAGQENSHRLWFNVMKPLASKANGREQAHLRAFRAYCEAASQEELTNAYSAEDSTGQRAAIAEWLYWQHLTELFDTQSAALV